MSDFRSDRSLALESALGPDVLLLESLRGVEAVSRLFHFIWICWRTLTRMG